MDATSLLNSLLNGDDEEIDLRLKSADSGSDLKQPLKEQPDVVTVDDGEIISVRSRKTKKSFQSFFKSINRVEKRDVQFDVVEENSQPWAEETP